MVHTEEWIDRFRILIAAQTERPKLAAVVHAL